MPITTIETTDMNVVEAFWTLLRPLKQEVKQMLISRLEKSILEEKEKASHEITEEDARKFIHSLRVKGTKKVPVDEQGIEALLSEKYGL